MEGNTMISESRTLYAAITNTDGTEGRGYEYPIAVCESPITASRLGKGRYVQGDDCRVMPLQMIKIEGKWYVEIAAILIIRPSDDDLAEQAEIERKEAAKAARNAAIAKARAAGLSDSDIEALMRHE
ncbi:MAG: hypothetical protein HC889_19400 [Synechococcaceae cyanobacterium SM1_2_3]|nr:hypothetical protein [Synechococcaceae cyanobacterium SM1_2_3]